MKKEQSQIILLFFYTSLMRRLCDLICSGLTHHPEPANRWYSDLKKLILDLLKERRFKSLEFVPPFESLRDNQEVFETCADEYALGPFKKFCTKVEEIAFDAGVDTDFTKYHQLTEFLATFDKFVENYKSSRNKSDKEFIQKIEKLKPIMEKALEIEKVAKTSTTREQNKNYLKSIHLLVEHMEPSDTIWLVLDERFDTPIRCAVKNNAGKPAYIKKLYDIAYFVDAPGKRVGYNKRLADNINNGLFKRRRIADYMQTNKIEKPTLVQKSEDGDVLVLTGGTSVKTDLIKNVVPPQHRNVYIDKTR